MSELTGSAILAKALRRQGCDEMFFLMGGPMLLAETECANEGIRMVDVRHEQAAAMMAHAYARLRTKPAACMAASGPGVTNLVTGLCNALVDCTPVVAVGGCSPLRQFGQDVFQEIDQMRIMEGCVKWSARVYDPRRIPEIVDIAFQQAMAGKPGPVYIDMPGDILYTKVPEEEINWTTSGRPLLRSRPAGQQDLIEETAAILANAERPVMISGSGILWSEASEAMHRFVDASGIPFYTTPQGRGVVPEDHPWHYATMRSTAFREADCILILGTRLNYIVGHAAPPRFNADARIVRIDIDQTEIAQSPRPIDIGIVADVRTALEQLMEAIDGRFDADRFKAWRDRLAEGEAEKRARPGGNAQSDEVPIHPLRLCEEVKNFMNRDAILVVDGQEILNYGRQSMPTHTPGHRLNSGPFGTMGVGLPYAIGAKVAKPDKQVICVHGDGSMGLNAMELEAAQRQGIPVLVVISCNGGWTADPGREKIGRDLGYVRFDRIAEALGCYGEQVEEPDGIRAALERGQAEVDKGRVAVINVVTDYRARAGTVQFAQYST